jgi:hypothetical protein
MHNYRAFADASGAHGPLNPWRFAAGMVLALRYPISDNNKDRRCMT